jgi:hypothetical protein
METGSYDECIVTEMRGQQISMTINVNRFCARRYGKEVQLPETAYQITFGRLGPDYVMPVEEKDQDYIITRGEFVFSALECGKTKNDDFIIRKTVAYDRANRRFSLKFSAFDLAPDLLKKVGMLATLECARTERVWGKYR